MNSIYQLSSPNSCLANNNVSNTNNLLLKQQLNNYLNQQNDASLNNFDLQNLLLSPSNSFDLNEMSNLNNYDTGNLNINTNIDESIQYYKKLILNQHLLSNISNNQPLMKQDLNNNNYDHKNNNHFNELFNNSIQQQQAQQSNKSCSNLQKLFELQQMKNQRMEKLLVSQQQQQTALNNSSINNLISTSSNGYISNKQANMLQHEFIKKVLETKKLQEQQLIQEQQYQNQLKLQQLQQQHQLLQQQQLKQQQQQQQQQQNQSFEQNISKEYILSKLKAQKEQQKQQQQLKQLQQQLQMQQNLVDNINVNNLISNNPSYSSNASSTSDLTTISETPSSSSQSVKINLMHLLNSNNNNNNNTSTSSNSHNQFSPKQSCNEIQPSSNKISQPKTPIEKLKMLLIKNNQLNEQQNSFKNLTNNIPYEQSQSNNTLMRQKTQSPPQPHHIKKNLVEISSEGIIKNIPPNMLVDQYGMLGLAMMYKHQDETQNEIDKNISIIIGKGQLVQSIVQETNKNMDSPNQNTESVLNESLDNNNNNNTLIKTDHLIKTTKLPSEYNISSIKNKLLNINDLLKSCKDDLLFYLFYMCCMDDLQTKASNLLVSRNWIFNKECKVWIKKMNSDESNDGSNSSHNDYNNNNNNNDCNLYYMFDVNAWQVKKINLNLLIENININNSNNNNNDNN